jgi:phage gp36-like protein
VAYTTRTELEQRFGADEIAQRESMLGTGSVDRALADADAAIDSYLAGRYVVPLDVVPAAVPPHAAIIARYMLLGDAVTERARNDYRDTIGWLRDVQAGKAKLDAAAPTPGNDPATVVMSSGSPAVFKRGLRQ